MYVNSEGIFFYAEHSISLNSTEIYLFVITYTVHAIVIMLDLFIIRYFTSSYRTHHFNFSSLLPHLAEHWEYTE